MSDLPYIIAAYTATWLVLSGYALYLTVRARRATTSSGTPIPEPADV